MPAFLVGSVVVLVREDMAFTETHLGLCIAAFYASTAVSSVHGGRLAERLGGLRAISTGVMGSAVALAAVAALARQWWHIAVLLLLAGAANGLTQPATNLALARAVPVGRQGLAFGVKQTDGSLATLVAGVAAAAIAVPFGWRWAFVAVAASSAVFFAVRPSADGAQRLDRNGDSPPDAGLRSLIVLAVGGSFAAAAGACLAGFYVDAATASGRSVAVAGWWLAAGSLCGTAGRIAWGLLADRMAGSPFRLVGALVTVGAVGVTLLGEVSAAPLFALATALSFGAGWGWPGVLLYGIVRASPRAPARATGIVLAGTSCGAVVGPLLFGRLAEAAGYNVAWRGAGAALVVSGVCILATDRLPRPPHALRSAADSRVS